MHYLFLKLVMTVKDLWKSRSVLKFLGEFNCFCMLMDRRREAKYQGVIFLKLNVEISIKHRGTIFYKQVC